MPIGRPWASFRPSMSLLSAALLGIVQALTEFLPVSSTAHLLVVGELLGHSLEDARFRAFVTIIQSGTTLSGYDAWVTGVRRVEAPTRANTPLVTYDEKFGLVKINPIAAWSDEDMDAYIAEHGILVNPLVDAGYPSIGCAPCTAKPKPGEDPRSGRWAGRAKTECGLHA